MSYIAKIREGTKSLNFAWNIQNFKGRVKKRGERELFLGGLISRMEGWGYKILFFPIDGEKKAGSFFIVLDERGKELISGARKAGFENPAADLAVRDIVRSDPDGQRIQRFLGLIIEG